MADIDDQAFQAFFAGKSGSSQRLIAADDVLCFVPETELFGTIGAGCNYHEIWNQDKLRQLSSMLDGRSGAAISALADALAKKTAKLQARYVGQILYSRCAAAALSACTCN